jgi:hypothetical protein
VGLQPRAWSLRKRSRATRPEMLRRTNTKQTAGTEFSFSYDARYIDYGGKANVDFYVTSEGKDKIVLVFMYAGLDPHDNTSSIQQILNSFSRQRPAS